MNVQLPDKFHFGRRQLFWSGEAGVGLLEGWLGIALLVEKPEIFTSRKKYF